MFLSFDIAKVLTFLEPGKFLIEFNPIEIICNFVKKKITIYNKVYIIILFILY